MASAANSVGEVLALWEHAAAAPAGRTDALLGMVFSAPPRSLSARNSALCALRARLFGELQALRSACPHCASSVEFGVDCVALSERLRPVDGSGATHVLEVPGFVVEFRVPDAADVRAAAAQAKGGGAYSESSFVEALLGRCIACSARSDGSPCEPSEWPESVARALSSRMEELEPGASVSFELRCPECGEGWSAPMNVGEVLWSELQSRAERLLLEVDVLARAYGWSEAQVLALSPTRRAAYLQLQGAG